MSQSEELQPLIVSEEMIDDELDKKLRKNLCVAFPHSAWYFKESRGWNGAFPKWNIIIFNRTQLPIGHIGVIERKISIGQKEFLIYGLQNVYVLSSYQGKGLATRMLREVSNEVNRLKFDFGLLFCRPTVESLYVNSGWRYAGRPTIYIDNNQGCKEGRSFIHDSLYFKAGAIESLPPGTIFLNGPDW